jgi:hypothetical protein
MGNTMNHTEKLGLVKYAFMGRLKGLGGEGLDILSEGFKGIKGKADDLVDPDLQRLAAYLSVPTAAGAGIGAMAGDRAGEGALQGASTGLGATIGGILGIPAGLLGGYNASKILRGLLAMRKGGVKIRPKLKDGSPASRLKTVHGFTEGFNAPHTGTGGPNVAAALSAAGGAGTGSVLGGMAGHKLAEPEPTFTEKLMELLS